jgi:hypothetical protein
MEESTDARLNVVDWLVQHRNTAAPNGEDSPDPERWLEQRLCRNVK